MSKEQEKIIASQKELLKEYEKENAELFENCKDKDRQLNNWFVSYNEVKKENAELKAQIEKMKNCKNCKYFNHAKIHGEFYVHCECVNLEKWELAE